MEELVPHCVEVHMRNEEAESEEQRTPSGTLNEQRSRGIGQHCRVQNSFETAVPSNSRIVSEPGKNITLTCQLQMKWPLQQVTWEKIQPHQIDLLTSCNLSQGRSYTSKYRRRILSNCSQGMRQASIVMPYVTASDSGLYRCRFKASTGENETFVMRLTVTDEIRWLCSENTCSKDVYGKDAYVESETDNGYILFVAGGTVLLLLFVILITTVIVILHKRRKRRQQSVLVKESWDTQNKAANNYRSPMFTNQPPDDAREDIYVNYPTFSRRPKIRV
ncbi:hypothetical protein HPG69_003659 [Diceros bicornis minor]|uniref:Ig-like domain-containing protein n=1 Tax=Diceros bicornis minor TaxID=77932 RepID=A0A7J7ETV5_DICBM|nr:hypothetical protein HPG69_003659 [Diceros bicornis minor]